MEKADYILEDLVISRDHEYIPAMGKHAFLFNEPAMLNSICEKFGRDPEKCVIKIFHGNPLGENDTLEDALWGDNHDPLDKNQVRKNCKLLEGTAIQNICWYHGLSARVYGVFTVYSADTIEGKKHVTQKIPFGGTEYFNLLLNRK